MNSAPTIIASIPIIMFSIVSGSAFPPTANALTSSMTPDISTANPIKIDTIAELNTGNSMNINPRSIAIIPAVLKFAILFFFPPIN